MTGIEYTPDHVAISVTNLDRSIAWYNTRFGFEEEVRFGREDLGMLGAMLRLGDYGLELFQPTQDLQPLPEYAGDFHRNLRTVGTNHLCLRVADLEATHEHLSGLGDELSDIIEGRTTRYFTVKDPDGMHVEIKQPYN